MKQADHRGQRGSRVVALGGVALAFDRRRQRPAPAPTTTTTDGAHDHHHGPTTTAAGPGGAAHRPARRATASASTAPPLVVKIDNVEPKARPQAGINQADVVYEERVEGSVTRLLAIFHSTDAARSGRCARPAPPTSPSSPRSTGRTSPGAAPTPPSPSASAAADVVDVGYDALPRRVLPRAEPLGAAATSCCKSHRQLIGACPTRAPAPPPRAVPVPGARAGAGPPRAGGRRRGAASARAAGGAPVEYALERQGLGPHPEGHAARRRRRRAGRAGQRHHPVRRLRAHRRDRPVRRPDPRGADWSARATCGCSPAGGTSPPGWSGPLDEAVARRRHHLHRRRRQPDPASRPGRTWVVLPTAGGAAASL